MAAKKAVKKTPAAKKAAAKKTSTAGNKTVATSASVDAFLAGVEPAWKREDARTLLALMTRISGEPARMWGPSIVGFGSYHYRYDSGREGDFLRTGFSPRKQNLTLYIVPGFGGYESLLARLGPHTTGVSCLYLKRLADIDLDVLEALVRESLAYMNAKYPQ